MISRIRRELQRVWRRLTGRGKPQPQQPPPDHEVKPTEPRFRWVPIRGIQVHVYIPSIYKVWRLGIWTGHGHKHVHPYNPASDGTDPWYWNDSGTPVDNGLTRYIVPVPPEVLRERALSFNRASGDLLLIQGNAAGPVEDGTRAVSWFVRPLVEVEDGPDANIRNHDNNWRGRP